MTGMSSRLRLWSRQLNTLPRCMRPEGDGAKRPTTGAGTEAGCVVGASAAGVAMLRVLISMRTSIARCLAGKALPRSQVGGGAHRARWVCVSRSRSPYADSALYTAETPAALRNCRGFRGKGGHDPRANGKGATVFAQLLYALYSRAQSARAAATQSRYTCDGAVKWYLLLTRDSAKERPKRQFCCCLSVQPNDPFSSVPNRSFSKCRGAGVTFIPFGTPVA